MNRERQEELAYLETLEDQELALLVQLMKELRAARQKHPFVDSYFHAYGVLQEEVEELWEEVKAYEPAKAKAEALQVASSALRLILEQRD